MRANDPLIYIGDRRSPPYIYRGGRFARRVGIGSDLASPAPGGTGASPAPGGTRPPSDFCRFPSRVSCPYPSPRRGVPVRGSRTPPSGRDAPPQRPSRVRSLPSRVRSAPHGVEGTRPARGGGRAPLTGREARPPPLAGRVPSSASERSPYIYRGSSLPPFGGVGSLAESDP